MIVPNDRIADADIIRAVPGTGLRIPFFSSLVQAGFPSPAESYIEHSLSLDELCIRHPEATYFVSVASDSMIGDRIDRGDVLVVDCAQEPSEGKVVVVWLNGDNVVKRIHYAGEIVILMPSNPRYDPIYVHPGDNFRLLGVVTFVIQKLP